MADKHRFKHSAEWVKEHCGTNMVDAGDCFAQTSLLVAPVGYPAIKSMATSGDAANIAARVSTKVTTKSAKAMRMAKDMKSGAGKAAASTEAGAAAAAAAGVETGAGAGAAAAAGVETGAAASAAAVPVKPIPKSSGSWWKSSSASESVAQESTSTAANAANAAKVGNTANVAGTAVTGVSTAEFTEAFNGAGAGAVPVPPVPKTVPGGWWSNPFSSNPVPAATTDALKTSTAATGGTTFWQAPVTKTIQVTTDAVVDNVATRMGVDLPATGARLKSAGEKVSKAVVTTKKTVEKAGQQTMTGVRLLPITTHDVGTSPSAALIRVS